MIFSTQQYNQQALALLGLILTNLFWAGDAIIARFVTADIPPLTLACGRWFFAFLFILPFSWPHLKGNLPVIRQRWLVIFLLGTMGIAIYNAVFYLAAHSSTAVNITLVASTLPLVALLISWILLAIRPTNWQLLGIAISLIGVLIIISQGDFKQFLSLHFNEGDILVFGLALLWSLYSVLLRKYPIKLNAVALITVLIAAGLPLVFVLFVVEWLVLPSISLRIDVIPAFLYVAIFPSILAYIFWNHGVKVLGPNITALSTYLMPLFTAILAVTILKEAIYFYHFIGGALILVGLYFGSIFKMRKINERD